MKRRVIMMPLAVIGSVGVALAPTLAQAATPSSAGGAKLTPATTASASQLAKAAGFKTFSSPKSKSVRVQKSVAARATGTVIYATTSYPCTGGDGSAAAPFCDLQSAVNAASPGDTIDVAGSQGYFSQVPVTITTSNLTIVGTSAQSWIAHSSGPAITLDGVTGVTIENLMLASQNSADVAIENSSDITIDSSYLGGYGYGTHDGVTVDGGSSNVAITRSYVDTGGWNANFDAVRVASGASNVTVASDLIGYSTISATGVSGLDITGNTIQRACTSGIDVEGASTGVYVENNVLDESNSYFMGPSEATCVSSDGGWAPDITVAPDAVAGTTADYNDFDVLSGDSTDPYAWNGTNYTTTSAFTSATTQGAHDTNDTTTFGAVFGRANESSTIQATPTMNSPATGSANTSAPGRLSSDFYGSSPYNTRGAIQTQTPNPGLAASITVEDSSAFGVTATVDVTGYNTVTASGASAVVNWGDGTTSTMSGCCSTSLPHAYAKLGSYTVSVTATDGAGDTVSNSVAGVETAGSEYTAYGPTRILDTRNGTGAAAAAIGAGKTLRLQVTGAGGSENPIPAGITAVVLNVTVAAPTANSFLTVYGDQDATGAAVSLPSTSNLNFKAGQNVPNLVVVPVGANGAVDFYNAKGSTQVIADVAGYFTPANTAVYKSMSPVRLLDTRKGTGTGKVAKIPANGSITLTVDGKGGIPATGVQAVAVNLTALDATANGVVTAYPSDESRPNVSNVNYSGGGTIANMAIVPVHSDGKVVFYNSGGSAVDLIADVFGYYTTNEAVAGAGAYLPLDQPVRVLDTRQSGGALDAGYPYYLPFTDEAIVTAGVFNATVVSPTGNGFFSIYPYDPTNPGVIPSTSNLNYRTGQTVPNLVLGSPGTRWDSDNGSYDLGLYLGGQGSAQLILDLFGVYEDA